VSSSAVPELRLFPNDACRRRFLELVGEIAKRYKWRVRAYCLMTAHYDLLVTTVEPTISDGMRDLNGRYARWYNRERGRRGHVFGARFQDEVVRTGSHLLECVRYISLNPVRAGMCNSPRRYPWGSYPALVGIRPPPTFLRAAPILQRMGRDRATAIARLRGFVETTAWPGGCGLALAA
jgi:putative transposase